MATHVTHGDKVSPHPGGGQGTGQGHPPPFAQLPPIDVFVVEAASAADAITGRVAAAVAEAAVASDLADAVRVVAAATIEAAAALDALDATAVAGGAVIPADVVEAAGALDASSAVSVVSAISIEPAAASDLADAGGIFSAVEVEAAAALDVVDAAVGAQVLFGTVVEAATALDVLDAVVETVEVPVDVVVGRYYPPRQRPLPVVGHGYGVLPQIEGEGHGVVGTVAKGAAQILVRAAAVGACGQAGNAAVVLKGLAVAGKGAVGTRGSGAGVIVKFSGIATGRHDDDEAAVIAFLLAA